MVDAGFLVYDNNDKNEKLKLGAKYTVFDISQDSIPKNKFYYKLNKYFIELYNKKFHSNHKKINLTKIDLHNLKLKKFHEQKIKKYKKLIDVSIKDVLEVKNNCKNWVNELKEKYNDFDKGFDIEKEII